MVILLWMNSSTAERPAVNGRVERSNRSSSALPTEALAKVGDVSATKLESLGGL